MANQTDYSKIIAKAWADDDYRKRLISDPASVLKAEGWDIHPSTTIRIEPDSDRHTIVYGLPKKPEGLTDEDLREGTAAAACSSPAPACC